jgi:hypothetical protein
MTEMAVAFAAAVSVLLVAAAPAAAAAADTQRLVSGTAPPPANDSIGVRLLDVPVTLKADPRAREYIIDNLLPGTTISRRIEVSNGTTAPLRATLYPAAATITAGAFIGSAGHTANDVSSWTTLSQGILDIPARTVVQDTVTIAVPGDASPGERYGVVWAEVVSADGGSVTRINRTGIRTYLSVGGSNAPDPQFTVDSMTAQRDPQGQPVVLAQVHNTGGRALDMSGTLTLSKVSGSLTAGPYPVAVGTTLAPGQSEPVTTAITDPVDAGPWNATISLQSGLLSQIYTAEVTFPDTAGSSPAVTAYPQDSDGNHIVLITLVSLGVLLFMALLLFLIWRRKLKSTDDTQRLQPSS